MIEGKGLPKSWKLVKLEDVIDVQGGSQPPKSNFIYKPKKSYVQLLQIRDFGKKGLPTYVPKTLVTKFCNKDDILIARYGASLGRIVTGLEGAYNVALAKVIDKGNNYDKRFIFYLLKTQIFQSPLKLLSRSAQNGFAKSEIADIEFPLPPLPEQHRIVAKLEELLSELEKGKEQLHTVLDQLKVYRQAVLNSTIKGNVYNTIESVIDSLDQGWSPKCLNVPSKNIKEWGVIKTTAVQAGHFDDSHNKQLPHNLEPRKQHELKVGDLLITRAGPRIRAGVCCLVKKTRPRLLNCDKVYRIRINQKTAIPEFVELLLNSPKYSKEIEKMKTGISDSGVNLTHKGFLKILIPTPTIIEQRHIVEEIENRLSVADKLEETITTSLQQSETLRQSILKKAFEGKLV